MGRGKKERKGKGRKGQSEAGCVCRGQKSEGDLDGARANLIMEWQGGIGPYTVQKAASLNAPVWEDVDIDVESPLSLPVDGTIGFFRIVAP